VQAPRSGFRMMQWLAQRFELARGERGHNVPPMEGLRGFAVFLVFLVHYVTFIDPWVAKPSALHSFASTVHTIGNTGVDLFFVLSGYLIYGSLISRPQRFLRFMSRRVERIYPAFIAVFVLYVVLAFVFPMEGKLPATPLSRTVYLVENFLLLPGLVPIEPMITVAWSLSYEMFFYLAIPLVIAVLGLRQRSLAWRSTFFSTVAIAFVVFCAGYGGPVRMIMFISGILLYEVISGGVIRAPADGVALSTLAVGLLVTLLPIPGSGGYSLKVVILFVAFFWLCFGCFGKAGGWLARGFAWTPLRWLGNMSYSYYLLHGLTLNAAFRSFALFVPAEERGPWFFAALLPCMFAVTLVPTTMLFLLVERPYSLAPRRAGTGTGLVSRRDPLEEQHGKSG